MKPPIRAIIEMSDELNQPEILGDYDEDISKTSYSSDSSFKKLDKLSSNCRDSSNTSHNNANENSNSSNSNKLEQSTSVAREQTVQNKQIEQQINSSNLSSQKIISSQAKIGVSKSTPAQTDQNCSNLNQLKSNFDIDAWNSLTEWVNSSLLDLDLDAAKISAKRLKRNHRNNFNGARAKSGDRTIHVNKELMQFFSDYLIDEYPEDIDSDYVFVSIWSHKVEPGTPLTYSAVDSLFRRLRKKVGIYATAHLLRHSHAY